jgi:hypothetical protein
VREHQCRRQVADLAVEREHQVRPVPGESRFVSLRQKRSMNGMTAWMKLS